MGGLKDSCCYPLLILLVGIGMRECRSSSYDNLFGNMDGKLETIYYPGGPKQSYFRPRVYERLEKADEQVYYPRTRPYSGRGHYGPRYNGKSLGRLFAPTTTVTPMTYTLKPVKRYRKLRVRRPQSKKGMLYRKPEGRQFPLEDLEDGRSYNRYDDPCVKRPQGQYDLDEDFLEVFPDGEPICSFVKCANKKAFLNQCGAGTRNNDHGSGFCTMLDLEGYCSRSVYHQSDQRATALESEEKDPCGAKAQGEYVLNKEFKQYFPYVDKMCYFVKCANQRAFLNPCGTGTRNNQDGSGYCSVLDLEGFCGRTVHDKPRRRRRNRKYRSRERRYREFSYGG